MSDRFGTTDLHDFIVGPTRPLDGAALRARMAERRRRGKPLYVIARPGPGVPYGLVQGRVYEVIAIAARNLVQLTPLGGNEPGGNEPIAADPKALREAIEAEVWMDYKRRVLGFTPDLQLGAIVKIAGPGWDEPYDHLYVIVRLPTPSRPEQVQVSRLGGGPAVKVLLGNITCLIGLTGLSDALHVDLTAG